MIAMAYHKIAAKTVVSIQVLSGKWFLIHAHSLLYASEGGGSTKTFPPASFLLLLVLFLSHHTPTVPVYYLLYLKIDISGSC